MLGSQAPIENHALLFPLMTHLVLASSSPRRRELCFGNWRGRVQNPARLEGAGWSALRAGYGRYRWDGEISVRHLGRYG